MDKPTTSKRLLSYSEDDIDRSTTGHSTGFDESSFGADDSFLNTRTPSSTDKDTFKLTPQPRPAPGKMSSQKKSATDLFPWLKDVEKSAQKCLGSIPEAKTKTILNAMDFLIRKMVEDCQKYCKSPRLSITLARYIREFLYTYRYLYKGFEMGIEFFRRVTKLLVIYTDLELCGSMSGQECDNEIANRIQLTYCTHLEGAEDFTVLDVFINMKRLSRIHRGVLSLLLKHFLVKITVKEPVEVEDDTFAKYLIVFKKWLAIEDIHEDKEDIRSAFITQVKPKKMFCMNSKYAPYLPAGDGQKTTDNYVRMLDKKFSLQPLLRALELTDKNFGEPSTIEITKKLNDVVVLSDDEENDASEIQLVNVKTECGETSDNSSVIDETSKPELIDLTEEAYEETNAPRLYISWLADLIERAKIKPTTMDQRLEGAHISSDIIVIDDPEESNETNKKPSDESQTTKITSENVSSIATSTTTTSISTSVTQTDSSSTDSGRVLSNREEVGIHWKNNFEMCPTSVNVECINETQADENQLCQPAQAGHGNVVANQLHLSNDDNSSECNAFNVSSSDGNKSMIPINMNIVASGSISSCSDEAAEQLLTVALKNQKLNDRLPTSMDLIDKVQQTSDVDCTVESTSLLFEPTSSDCLPQPSQMPEPSTATVYRRLQVVNDKNLGINFDLKADELAQNDELIAAESVNDAMDEYNAKMLRSQAKKCITVVHPTRHNQSPINAVCKSESTADYPQDMTSASSSTSSTSSSQKHFECSIPLSSIKTNNLFTKTVDNRSSPQSYERTIRSTQNVITAELSIDNNVQATANTSSFARRRVVDKPEIVNDNENVPSTIMERKTYIKKPSNKTTSTENRATRPHHRTRSPTLTIESRQTSQSILPQQKQQAISQHSTSDQHQQQQQQQQQLQQQLQQQHQQHISPSKTTQTQHQPYKLFYSDEELPFLTPYDVFLNEDDEKMDETSQNKGTQSSVAVQASPKEKQMIAEKNLSYEISDEKLLTAAAQLVDVYNKRSKASATITVQKKPIIESPRNRTINLNKSQTMRSPMIVPNFVVTKITEKTPDKVTINRQIREPTGASEINIVKMVRKQEEPEQTKRNLNELQRQRPVHYLNQAREFKVKNMSILNKNVSINDRNKATTSRTPFSGASQMNKAKQNEPVILNFRAKMHDSIAEPRKREPMTLNGRKNTYRVPEMQPISKNSMDRSMASQIKAADRYRTNMSNKLYASSIASSVRPVSMPVTKVYSRFPSNSIRKTFYNNRMHRPRAPILRKFPSMSNISNGDKVHTNFFDQTPYDKVPDTSKDSTNLMRVNSCFIIGSKSSAALFEKTIRNNEDYSKLYNLCSDVVSKLCFKGQTIRRKRGRPRKKVYQSLTKDLLNSPEFSLKADIVRLHEMYYASKRFGGQPFAHILNSNPRRSKRCALLSIEPVLTESIESSIYGRYRERERSPVGSFHINRVPLKTYSRVNMIQPRQSSNNKRKEVAHTFSSKPHIQLLNIEPLSSTSQSDMRQGFNEEVTQSTEYIIETDINADDIDESDAIYIEYLEDNDEIESPAYEPVAISEIDTKPSSIIITEEADTTVESCSSRQQTNYDRYRSKKSLDMSAQNFKPTTSYGIKQAPSIEFKYLRTSEIDAHSTTDPITEIFATFEPDDKTTMMILPQKKPELNVSPVRKSTRKRKIPSEFPNFAKKIRS
ncbi:uncharacterized protein LOC116338602 [Contarinia nasturtii]|uniref:uncharacterized protein LOC116338602 n=1 Tax=Contarinia nasturtii TaxID=265458 RepID=UPI0012D4412A|nr:uncharacterized protein LOC116338602 [Contarinia nasturtii]XP_031619840.1 uncharacterized protein LOC116338602 [Contarinia nasturtii]